MVDTKPLAHVYNILLL